MIPVRIIMMPTSRGFLASVPALPGLTAQGETELQTIAVAKRMIRERLAGDPMDPKIIAGRQQLINLEEA